MASICFHSSRTVEAFLRLGYRTEIVHAMIYIYYLIIEVSSRHYDFVRAMQQSIATIRLP